MKLFLDPNSVNKIHLGAGRKIIPGWINIDGANQPGINYVCNLTDIECEDNTVDEIYICHALEHLTETEAIGLLFRIRYWLKDNGVLCLAVPNFEACVQHYVETGNLKDIKGMLMGGHSNTFASHKALYDERTLIQLLKKIGYTTAEKYNWKDHTVGQLGIDDYSQSYLPHLDKENGKLMSLNIRAQK